MNVFFKRKRIVQTSLAIVLGLSAIHDVAAEDRKHRGGSYEISVTNITQAQIISPFIVSTHRRSFPLFTHGETASPELAAIAQDADNTGMEALLIDVGDAQDLAIATSPVLPGQTISVVVSAKRARYLNLAAMLVTTNDAFIAINNFRLRGRDHTFTSIAYDAGAENNDESCAYIPGPPCGNAGISSDVAGEGFIYTHSGIQGVGDLDATYDWNNPVAIVHIKRIN